MLRISKFLQNCSDSEDSSGRNHPAQLSLRTLKSDLESLEEHYYSDLRQYSATLERDFPAHYTTQQLNTQEWDFDGHREGIQRFLSLPTTWPLARLVFPIRDLRKQMETLLQTYCFEIEVTCAKASEQDAFVRRMALHLVQYLAVFLAETITELLQRVLTHKRISPSMTLVTLKCDSVPWANYFTQGQKGPLHAGFQTGNLLQLTFPYPKTLHPPGPQRFCLCLIPYLRYPSRAHD